MRLVFIYGPPASGKLTVGTELAKLTGFKLFHNHVSIQFVQSIFDFGTKTFWRLTGKYRLEMIEEAAKEGIDTIFTFVYSKGEDDKFVRRVLQKVRSNGGQVYLVRLYCDRKELVRRVKSSQRRRMGKVGTEKMLSERPVSKIQSQLRNPASYEFEYRHYKSNAEECCEIDCSSIQAIVAARLEKGL